MRRSTLLPALLAAACAAPEQDPYAVIDGFLDRAVPASCTLTELPGEYALTEIRSITDSTWLLLDEPQRRVTAFDHESHPLWSVALPAMGPGAVVMAASAAPLGDTAVAIADRGSLRLHVLSRTGEVLRSTPLSFIPHSLATTADGRILVTPMRVGDDPPTLLVRYDGDRRTDLAVPPRWYEHPMIRAMGSVARVETFPDGRAVVAHEYLAPRAFLVGPDDDVRAAAMPTPDGTLDQLEYLPMLPLTEEDADRILTPSINLGVDRARSEVWVLTRTGRVVDGVSQRALLRLDDRLGFLEGFTADVSAFGMAVLPRHRRVILADDDDRIYSCALPDPGVHAHAP